MPGYYLSNSRRYSQCHIEIMDAHDPSPPPNKNASKDTMVKSCNIKAWPLYFAF